MNPLGLTSGNLLDSHGMVHPLPQRFENSTFAQQQVFIDTTLCDTMFFNDLRNGMFFVRVDGFLDKCT